MAATPLASDPAVAARVRATTSDRPREWELTDVLDAAPTVTGEPVTVTAWPTDHPGTVRPRRDGARPAAAPGVVRAGTPAGRRAVRP